MHISWICAIVHNPTRQIVNRDVQIVHHLCRSAHISLQPIIRRESPLVHSLGESIQIAEHRANLVFDGLGLFFGQIIGSHAVEGMCGGWGEGGGILERLA